VRHLFRKRGLRSPLYKVLEFLILFPVLPFYLLEKLLADLDSQWSWFPLAARRGYALCREVGPELVYSTGGPASAHIAAGMIAHRMGIPWVAEFQDPLLHGGWYRGKVARKAFSLAERYICARASRVVFLTEEAMRRAAARTGLGDRGRFLYPGADPPSVPPPVRGKGEHLRFAHLGSFGGSRNPDVLLAAARQLLEERPALAETVRLDFYGHCDANSARRIRVFPVPGVATYHGRVTRREALAAMQDADILVLIQNIDDFSVETIPSKVYEYLVAGRPILGLVHRNAELAGMLTRLGHTVAEAADVGSVRGVVGEIHRSWEEGTQAAPAASPYTLRATVERLIAIAEDREPVR
jgi:hypothetical protein